MVDNSEKYVLQFPVQDGSQIKDNGRAFFESQVREIAAKKGCDLIGMNNVKLDFLERQMDRDRNRHSRKAQGNGLGLHRVLKPSALPGSNFNSSTSTTVFPTGNSEASASFTCAQAKGMPMMVQAAPVCGSDGFVGIKTDEKLEFHDLVTILHEF